MKRFFSIFVVALLLVSAMVVPYRVKAAAITNLALTVSPAKSNRLASFSLSWNVPAGHTSRDIWFRPGFESD